MPSGKSLQRTEITAETLLEAVPGLRRIDSVVNNLLDAAEYVWTYNSHGSNCAPTRG